MKRFRLLSAVPRKSWNRVMKCRIDSNRASSNGQEEPAGSTEIGSIGVSINRARINQVRPEVIDGQPEAGKSRVKRDDVAITSAAKIGCSGRDCLPSSLTANHCRGRSPYHAAAFPTPASASLRVH